MASLAELMAGRHARGRHHVLDEPSGDAVAPGRYGGVRAARRGWRAAAWATAATCTSGGAQATLIMHSGFDGWAEELHHTWALAAQERGYTVITFDGPGQGRPCYDGLVFRPDWETVVSPVIDWAAARPEVDPGRIALAGYSMGGGLAPRAAAFEQRIRALICIDEIYDIGLAYTERLGLGADTERRLTAESDPGFDAMAQQMMTPTR